MIKVLERKLQEAKEERAKVVAPYDNRIKKLSSAIKNLKEFDSISSAINESDKEEVAGVPSVEEAVAIREMESTSE